MKRVDFLMMTTVLSLGALSFSATLAQAGFQWHPPAPPAVVAPLPAQPVADETMGPLINWQQGPEDIPVEAVALSNVAPPLGLNVAPPLVSLAVSEKNAVLVDKNPDPGTVVEGFGDGITLVMAMRDIAPVEYQFSFGREIDLSAPADWQGGRPWKEVMTDVLKEQGLRAAIYGQMIVVSGGDLPPAPPVPGVSASSDVIEPIAAPFIARDDYDAKTHEAMIAQMTKRQDLPAVTPPAVEKPIDVIRWESAAPSLASDPVQEVKPLHSSVASVYQEKEIIAPTVEPVVPPPVVEKPIDVIHQESAKPPLASDPVQEVRPLHSSVASVYQEKEIIVPTVEPVFEPTLEMNDEWYASQGSYLHDVLKAWADRAGVKLLWTVDYDYRLPQNRNFEGSFEQVVAGLLNGFEKVRPQPYGQLHRGKDGGPATLVIKTY